MVRGGVCLKLRGETDIQQGDLGALLISARGTAQRKTLPAPPETPESNTPSIKNAAHGREDARPTLKVYQSLQGTETWRRTERADKGGAYQGQEEEVGERGINTELQHCRPHCELGELCRPTRH